MDCGVAPLRQPDGIQTDSNCDTTDSDAEYPITRGSAGHRSAGLREPKNRGTYTPAGHSLSSGATPEPCRAETFPFGFIGEFSRTFRYGPSKTIPLSFVGAAVLLLSQFYKGSRIIREYRKALSLFLP